MSSSRYMLPALVFGALIALPATAPAQGESALRTYFEGKTVVLKLDMPATEDGVDVHPTRERPVDFPRYATRLKDHGTAIKSGERSIVTKIRVKDKHIEFQLGGGGYGTFFDETSSDVTVPSAAKTQREKNLERDIPREADPKKKREMQEELDDLRKAREREDARNEAATAEAEQKKREIIQDKRLRAGSRFNIRYDARVPRSALTPQAVKEALAQYVEFPTESFGGLREVAESPAAAPAPRATGPAALKKGMSADEVDRLLGRPTRIAERMEGTLKVSAATYLHEQVTVEAEFVEGVLVRYAMSSR